MLGPDPTAVHPLAAHERVVFLKPLVTAPHIVVGEYTYYDDPDGATRFETRNVFYAYGPERLVIGKYCAIATGTRFPMAGAVVIGDVAPYTIVGGNPAKPIRQRNDDADVERLRRAAWWDWPVELVTEHARTIKAGTPADIERIAAGRAR
jgi:acetyltransferase-like isoleucine patch superfamily enzyme